MRLCSYLFLLGGLLLGSRGGVARPGLWPVAVVAGPDSSQARPRKIVAQLDQHYSPLNGKLVTIYGLKLGVEWRGRLRAGLGGYRLSSGVPTPLPPPPDLPAAATQELRFRYLTVYGEYVLIGTPRWELSTPTQLGFGRVFASYGLPDGGRGRSSVDRIWLVEPSLVGHMRVFRWIGVGVGAGYRQMLFLDSPADRELSGAIFIGRVKLFLGDLYRILRTRERLLSQPVTQ